MPPGIGYSLSPSRDRSRFEESDGGILGGRQRAFLQAARSGATRPEGTRPGIGAGLLRGADFARAGAGQGALAGRLGALAGDSIAGGQQEELQARNAFLANRDAVRAQYRQGISSLVRGGMNHFGNIALEEVARERGRPGANDRWRQFVAEGPGSSRRKAQAQAAAFDTQDKFYASLARDPEALR